jgi:hypothetical protein
MTNVSLQPVPTLDEFGHKTKGTDYFNLNTK